jgi:hypothetical protein
VTVTQTSAGFDPEVDPLFSVQVSCEVKGLAMLGLDIDPTMDATFSSPLDPFRRSA